MINSPSRKQDARRLLPPAAMAALSAGEMAEALLITQAALGVDLKEARALVDDYLARNPAIRKQLENPGTIWKSNRLILAALLASLIWWGVVYLLSG